jgi:hypothetical protein
LASGGFFISPDEVVYLPKLHHELRAILASCPGKFFEPRQISEQFLRHYGNSHVERLLFPGIETSLAMIGEVLTENPSNSIGVIPHSALENWIATAGDFPNTTLQSAKLIRKADSPKRKAGYWHCYRTSQLYWQSFRGHGAF